MDDVITKDHRGLDQARPASNQPGHTPYYHDDDDDHDHDYHEADANDDPQLNIG